METREEPSAARQLSFATIVAFWLVTLAVNSPGHLSFDSIVQLEEARSRSYAGFHPPLMSYLMMLFDSTIPGTALFLVFVQALFFGAMILIILSVERVRWWTAPIIAVGCLHPFVIVYQGIVWKDVLFANLSVFAFAWLYVARNRKRLWRWSAYGIAVISAACAALVRQNGAIVLLVLTIAITYLETPARNHILKLLGGAAAAVAIFFVAAIGTNALIHASANKPPGDTFAMAARLIFFYDIGAVLAAGGNPTVLTSIDASAVQSDAARFYDPHSHDRLVVQAPRFRSELRKLSFSESAAAWRQLIAENPIAYLNHRLAVFGWMIWPPIVSKCLPLHLGIDGRSDTMARLELPQGMRPSDKALYGYAVRFVETPVYRHGLFLILAVLLAATVMMRHGPLIAAPALALVAAAVLFTLSWIVVGVNCEIRYMYFLPLALLVSLVMASAIEAENSAPAQATVS
jgi:hypothetical protein